MRLFTAALCTTAAAALLAGCSGSQVTPGTSGAGSTQSSFAHHGKYVPHWAFPATLVPVKFTAPHYQKVIMSLGHKGTNSGGIYVTEFEGSSIYGYQHKNTANNPPSCTISLGGTAYINGMAVDGKGNFIAPLGESPSTGARQVNVYTGPGMCGSLAGTIADPYGQPSDASSPDAVNGTIAVGNIFDNSGAGSVSLCTLSSGTCSTNLTNSAMYEVAGVAMDNSGNCWASATDSGGTATLTYFAGCAGSGVQATGYLNSSYGGLDIDRNGNLVSISAFSSQLYVYSGCNPACTLVGGPYAMQGEAVFGHLNKQSMTFCAGDFADGTMDVYYYSPAALTYWYSFSNGLQASYTPEGCAYNPRSTQ
jgi:hypothetical protein